MLASTHTYRVRKKGLWHVAPGRSTLWAAGWISFLAKGVIQAGLFRGPRPPNTLYVARSNRRFCISGWFAKHEAHTHRAYYCCNAGGGENGGDGGWGSKMRRRLLRQEMHLSPFFKLHWGGEPRGPEIASLMTGLHIAGDMQQQQALSGDYPVGKSTRRADDVYKYKYTWPGL